MKITKVLLIRCKKNNLHTLVPTKPPRLQLAQCRLVKTSSISLANFFAEINFISGLAEIKYDISSRPGAAEIEASDFRLSPEFRPQPGDEVA